MKTIKAALTWCILLNKRVLKQPLFLLLLLMIPALVLGVRLAAPGQTELVRAGICAEDQSDPASAEVIARLSGLDSDVIRDVPCASRADMEEKIRSGSLRLGFLFPADLTGLFEAYGSQKGVDTSSTLAVLGSVLGSASTMEHPILCLTGSNDIAAKLVTEHLYGCLYRDLSYAVLCSFISSQDTAEGMSREEIGQYAAEKLAGYRSDANFFELQYVSGEVITDEALSLHFVSPMRGLLCALLVLTALSAALLLAEDKKQNRFVWVRPGHRPVLHFACILIPLIDAGCAMYLALYLSGTFTTWQSELVRMILFLLMTAGFANLLRILVRNTSLLAGLLPILLCGCLFLTPVFFDLNVFAPLQMLLPPYLYLRSIHGNVPLWSLAVYAAIAAAAGLIADRKA